MMTIAAGTLLYHGTDCSEFDEENDHLQGPAWLSSSRAVAEHFAKRGGRWGGSKRVVTYKVATDIQLPVISSARAMQAFAEEHGIRLTGVEDMRDTADQSGIPGWIIPNNYPEGDDILLVDTSALDYVTSEPAV